MERRKLFVPIFVFTVLTTIYVAEFLVHRISVLNVSAVETAEHIGVYWDENCSVSVDSIDWGILSSGEARKVVVYVRNEGNESFVLTLINANWNPEKAFDYMRFALSCGETRMGIGEVVDVTPSLIAYPYVTGVTNFSFDIIFEAISYLLGDIDRDGKCEMVDVAIVCFSFGCGPKDSRWNPDADLNKDTIVDMMDIAMVTKDFGKTFP